MKLSDLLKHVPGILARPEADPDIIAPIVEDSRAVEPGGIFVARVGGSADGHRFIPDAVAPRFRTYRLRMPHWRWRCSLLHVRASPLAASR